MNDRKPGEPVTNETKAKHTGEWTGGKEGRKAVWQVPFGVFGVILLLVVAYLLLSETSIFQSLSIYDTNPTVMD